MEAMRAAGAAARAEARGDATISVDVRRQRLAERIERHRDDPDNLATVIATGLADGFACDLDEATAQLLAVDHDCNRALQLRVRMLLATMRIDDAHELVEPIAARPDAPADVLALAARIAERLGDDQAVESYLERALAGGDHLPALDHLLERRAARGDTAVDHALADVATQPGSRIASRAKLAGRVLERGDEVAAREAYRRVIHASLTRAAPVEAAAVFTVIVRDLMAADRADLAVELVEPAYDPDVHGVTVGLQILDACVAVGARDHGMVLLERLTRIELLPDPSRIDRLRSRLED